MAERSTRAAGVGEVTKSSFFGSSTAKRAKCRSSSSDAKVRFTHGSKKGKVVWRKSLHARLQMALFCSMPMARRPIMRAAKSVLQVPA